MQKIINNFKSYGEGLFVFKLFFKILSFCVTIVKRGPQNKFFVVFDVLHGIRQNHNLGNCCINFCEIESPPNFLFWYAYISSCSLKPLTKEKSKMVLF